MQRSTFRNRRTALEDDLIPLVVYTGSANKRKDESTRSVPCRQITRDQALAGIRNDLCQWIRSRDLRVAEASGTERIESGLLRSARSSLKNRNIAATPIP